MNGQRCPLNRHIVLPNAKYRNMITLSHGMFVGVCVRVCSSHLVGVGLNRQGRVDRQHLEQEGKLALEGVFDFGSQAAWEVSNPLAQGGLAYPVVLDLSIGFRVGAHPQLDSR